MFIEIEIDGEVILIETADNVEDADLGVVYTDVTYTWEDVKSWFKSKIKTVKDYRPEKLINIIKKFTRYLYNSCSNFGQIPEPNEIDIEFSVGFSITGDVFIAKSTASSGIRITMKWMT
ncbi:MAG: CU044_2847 family protein [Candidatus Odinarchaeota archaeon]